MSRKQGAAGLEEIICCAIWMSFCPGSELSFLPRQWVTRLMLWDLFLPGSQMEAPITATHRFTTIWKPFKQEMEQKHKIWPDPLPGIFFLPQILGHNIACYFFSVFFWRQHSLVHQKIFFKTRADSFSLTRSLSNSVTLGAFYTLYTFYGISWIMLPPLTGCNWVDYTLSVLLLIRFDFPVVLSC